MKKKTLLGLGSFMTTVLFLCITSCSNEHHDSKEDHKKETIKIGKDGEIYVLNTADQFEFVIAEISKDKNSLFVFDIDNTLLITNDNKFGSDWWYSQTKDHPDLKLGVDSDCLFNVLTPMFYAMFDTKPVFPEQPEVMDALEHRTNKIIALTSRGYSPIVAPSTELELTENKFDFMLKDSLGMNNGVVMLNNVIYTRGNNKGVALLEYLEKYPYKNIYYFDDSFYKVENVQNAFKKAKKEISLYHMKIAPKIPYTQDEMDYMKNKLCIVINSINAVGRTTCNCKN